MLNVYLVHGAWCDSSHVAPLAHRLSHFGFRVRGLSLPGHGPEEDPSYRRISDYVDSVSRALTGPTILVGHSMGGLIAQHVAKQNPLVSRLVLLASAPPPGILYRGTIWTRVWRCWRSFASSRAFCLNEADVRDLLLAPRVRERVPFRSESGGAVREMVLAQFAPVSAMVVPCPVLVIGGTEDQIITTSVTARCGHHRPLECSVPRVSARC